MQQEWAGWGGMKSWTCARDRDKFTRTQIWRAPESEFYIRVKGDSVENLHPFFLVSGPGEQPSLLELLMPDPPHGQVAWPGDLCCPLVAVLREAQGSPLSRCRFRTHCSHPDSQILGLLAPGRNYSSLCGPCHFQGQTAGDLSIHENRKRPM